MTFHGMRSIAWVTGTSLLLCLFFFAPRLWVIASDAEGAPQLVRARTFLAQCEQPFRVDVEPAMRWRLLPPFIAYITGLRGRAALVLPWLGIVVVTTYVSSLFRSRLPDWKFVFGGTLLFSTTSAVVFPLGYLGMNDAWVWLGLLTVAFGRSRWSLPLACLLCPWIDERMIIGYPLAWLVRCLDRREPFLGPSVASCLWLIPYVIARLVLGGAPGLDSTSDNFIRAAAAANVPLVGLLPLAWWMGLRAAWLPVAYTFPSTSGPQRWMYATTFAVTLIVTWLLASDLSRSIAIVIPAILLGSFEFARRHPTVAPRALLGLGCVNLFIPAATVIFKTIDPINPLPLELYRLLRHP
jgi:hypothetical protein